MAWLIRQVFWVPHRFRYGILVAGGWSNVGDIRTSCIVRRNFDSSIVSATAVIMSITAAQPFAGQKDQNLSVAYISAFILVYMVSK
jgi:hypothetical protein